MAEYIVAEKSQRNPNEKPWWWLSGNTYPHRQLLKQQGARFSGKRRAWYFIGWELPASIRQLLAPELEAASVAVETDDALASTNHIEVASAINVKPTDVLPDDRDAERNLGTADEPPDLVGDKLDTVLTVADESEIQPDEPPAAKAPAVRVIRSSSIPPSGEPLDAVQSAIQEVKALPLMPQPVSIPMGNSRLMRINSGVLRRIDREHHWAGLLLWLCDPRWRLRLRQHGRAAHQRRGYPREAR